MIEKLEGERDYWMNEVGRLQQLACAALGLDFEELRKQSHGIQK